MIDEIQVRNVALIEQATLLPSRGLTVLTGETGAGKTALLSAMKLLMGARSSADMVRDGASGLEVSGRFFFTPNESEQHDAGDIQSDEADEPFEDDGELVVTRRVGLDGRSRVSLNGRMASVREVAQKVAPHVDLCGQFEHQQLMKPAAHVGMLDSWAGQQVLDVLGDYRAAFDEASRAAAELDRIKIAASEGSAKLDDARFTLARIDEVSPVLGEYEELRQSLELAEHAESLATAVAVVRDSLAGDEGALDRLSIAADQLEQVSSVDPTLGQLASSLREVGYVVEDVAAEVRGYQDKIDFDPQMLAESQERFAALQGLMRSFGPTMDQVFGKRDQAKEAISLVDDADVRLRAATAALDAAEERLAAAADALDSARGQAAPRFSEAVSKNMARMEMSGAEIECRIERLDRSQWTKSGPSAVEFMYRPGHGMQARPLARIASGGEVSRVMLAIKVVLGETDAIDTLVFDEVDAGVGGSTAVALAEVLADLAKTHQVIVVTHLAQVAVRGDSHYVAKKSVSSEGAPVTVLSSISGDDRVAEIARMLSGDATDASIAHAREMLLKQNS